MPRERGEDVTRDILSYFLRNPQRLTTLKESRAGV